MSTAVAAVSLVVAVRLFSNEASVPHLPRAEPAAPTLETTEMISTRC
jgi:hypothetical protein